MRYADSFPIGFLKCSKCGEAALWLIENTDYQKVEHNNTQVSIKYRLVNRKLPDYNPDDTGDFYCDNCGCIIKEDNLDGKYIEYFSESDIPKTKQ